MTAVLGAFACAALLRLPHSVQSATPGAADSVHHPERREPARIFLSSSSVREGDTLRVYPKRVLRSGMLSDFPPGQLFHVRLADGSELVEEALGRFVFPDGTGCVDTTGVPLPLNIYVIGRVSMSFSATVEALDPPPPGDPLWDRRPDQVVLTGPTPRFEAGIWDAAGNSLLRNRHIDDALICFRRAAALDTAVAAYAFYNIACAHAVAGRNAKALDSLRAAVRRGYSDYVFALKDSDLVSLRGLPEFKTILCAPHVDRRTALITELGRDSARRGALYFEIARTYLAEAETDSFFVALDQSLRISAFPSSDIFEADEFRAVRSDPRFDSIMTSYAARTPNLVFTREIEGDRWPHVIHRMYSNSYPFNLGNCCNLISLTVCDGRGGRVPPALGLLPHLRSLRIYTCEADSFPRPVALLTHLDTLELTDCRFHSIPPDIQNLSSLRSLSLHGGRLTSFDSRGGSLSNLRDLDLSENRFERFPDGMLRSASLSRVDLSANSIGELPPDIARLRDLSDLRLSDNRLNMIPRSLAGLRRLKSLDLSINSLTSIPPELGELDSLENLDISFNDLTSIPRTFAHLAHLKTLNVEGNQLDDAEISWLRSSLPRCRILGCGQDSFVQGRLPGAARHRDSHLRVSFLVPRAMKREMPERPSPEDGHAITFSRCDTTYGAEDTVTYAYVDETAFTIRRERGTFARQADEAGFERSHREDLADSKDCGEGGSQTYVSLGRQGMEEPAFAISAGGWRGLYGGNYTGRFGQSASGEGSGYQGLREIFLGFARRRLPDGSAVCVSFYSDAGDGKEMFFAILTSVRVDR